MPQTNYPIHVEWSIMFNAKASSIEAELGGLFDIFQKSTSKQIALAKMVHIQTPTTVAIDNFVENVIVNETTKLKVSRSIDMTFYLVCYHVIQNHSHILWD